ncbi:MAG: ATP-binding protein [Elainella sp. Prado103]|jgi:signal transduction histidine kinase/CheY-like chemotaxis protein|nr:ATP-binding protein [Elainella sp. Prado103]
MGTSCTLLIVDDCAEDREVCRRYLSQDPHQAYEILEADSAERGLSLCQAQHCDAILLDFCLPSMNGLEFLELLQRHQSHPVPVILLTGFGAEEVAVQALKMGAQDYLAKQHLQADMLQSKVRSAIQHWQSQRQHDRVERRQRYVCTVALHMWQSLDRGQVLETATTEIYQLLECDRVAIYQLLPDQGASAEQEAKTNGAIDAFRHFALEPAIEPATTSLTSSPSLHRATPSLTQATHWQKVAESGHNSLPLDHLPQQPQTIHTDLAELACCSSGQIVLPIQFTQGESPWLWGILVAQNGNRDRPWHTDEVTLLQALVTQLGMALQQAEQFQQMQAAVEQSKQLSVWKSQMVATVSHEYRRLLTTILAAASTLKLNLQQLSGTQQQHFLSTIEDKARLMTRLADDLLVLEKLELGKMKVNPLPFNLLEFVADLVEEQRQLIGNQHEIILSIRGNLKGVWGDRDLLHPIVVNLIANGVKFSPAGGKIDVQLRGDENHLYFSVQDWGIGIPPSDQLKLCQPFFRGTNVDKIEGTGLGLAIVRAYVELHQGDMTIESTEGEGTLVLVRLPKRLPTR